MRKRLFAICAVTAGLFMASCSNDELFSGKGGDEAQVSFALNVENGVHTKGISDGTSVDKLVYAVYDETGKVLPVFGANQTQKVETGLADLQAGHEVKISLAKGQTYQIAFWAQDADCGSYNTDDLKNVIVNYAGVNNDETRDAFFKTVTVTVSGDATVDVELKRPFAQLNVGVTKEDWAAAKASGIEVQNSKVKINNAATSLDLLTGKVGGKQEVEFDLAEIPAKSDELLKVDFDNDGALDEFVYLSMSYFLVNDETTGSAKTTLNSLEFTFDPANGNDIVFSEGLTNVPVQRNWRTNILGQLLTGNMVFNITVDPIYDGEYNNNDALGVQAGGKYYETIADAIKDGKTELKLAAGSYTLPTLSKDVTFEGVGEGTVIDMASQTISGQNVTFKNLTMKRSVEGYKGIQHATSENYENCVIDGTIWIYAAEASFKNCVFNVSGDNYNSWIYGQTDVTFENCTFNCEGKSLLVYNESKMKKNITVTNSKFISKQKRDGKAAIQMHTEFGIYGILSISNSSATGFDETINGGLWNELNNETKVPTENFQKIIDGKHLAFSAAGIQNAIKSGVQTLYLASGTYEGFFNLTGKTMTIQANEGANPIINGMVWVDNCTVTLKGLTMSNPNGEKHPNSEGSQYYNTINNQNPCIGAYNNAKVTMEGCTFNLTEPTVYGFYGYANNTPIFKNCTFNCNGIRPIATNGPSVTVDGCTFNNQYHYSLRIFENSGEKQTVVFTNNKIQGSNEKNEFEGINISKKGSTATVVGDFTIKGNTLVKYRHHKNVTMSEACVYDTDMENFVFEKEQD